MTDKNKIKKKICQVWTKGKQKIQFKKIKKINGEQEVARVGGGEKLSFFLCVFIMCVSNLRTYTRIQQAWKVFFFSLLFLQGGGEFISYFSEKKIMGWGVWAKRLIKLHLLPKVGVSSGPPQESGLLKSQPPKVHKRLQQRQQ